ncbi:hypothetical protein AX17_001693 [Amanita inopinata Kibby_2008]|nr:hypothetical protein AX17_001693 [Amanita inopinata Kibby_2008]
MNSNSTQLRRPAHRTSSRNHLPSLHWLFRSNIPRRRNSFLPNEIHKRNFFGMGEILSVLVNPAETVRSITESKRLLDEARQELAENHERAQLRTKHTFSRLPSFFPRKAEMKAIEHLLDGEPSFTILFGASSVGKTALLREVLSREQYHVLHFDLRIAGFADLASLYASLSQQMEQYFEEIAAVEGYEDFQKEAWTFKHDRIKVERQISCEEDAPRSKSCSTGHTVRTCDISRLMELFQSSLLKYREFNPDVESEGRRSTTRPQRQYTDETSEHTRINFDPAVTVPVKRKSRWNFRKRFLFNKMKYKQQNGQVGGLEKNTSKAKPDKKMPVFFIDEAHRLPSLIKSSETMKCLLESMLVLTKQDRLCHVIHATSDPFYQTWLRQLNVVQHCKILTIGDCSKSETRIYFRDHLLSRVPERIRPGLDFEQLFEAFGGKLAHWNDYITDYVNSHGTLDVKQCSHFLQAHSLLNLHIIHSSQSETTQQQNGPPGASSSSHLNNPSLLHPNLGPAGFRTYSPSTHGPSIAPRSPDGGLAAVGMSDDRVTAMVAGYYSADFSAMQLLKVMSRLAGRSGRGSQSGTVQGPEEAPYLPYFLLCREMGVRAVDAMVKGRVLGLRWTEPITKEGVETRIRSGVSINPPGYREGDFAAQSSGTAVDLGVPGIPVNMSAGIAIEDPDDEEMIAVPEHEIGGAFYDDEDELLEVVGPKLVPITPIMRYAMKEVVQEYEDDGSVSEYASVIDPDEY